MQQQQMSNAGEESNFGGRRMWRPNNSGGATKICHLGEVYWIRRKSQKRQDLEDDDDLVHLLLLILHLTFLLPKMTKNEKHHHHHSPVTKGELQSVTRAIRLQEWLKAMFFTNDTLPEVCLTA